MGDIKQTCDFNQIHHCHLVSDVCAVVVVVELAEVEVGVVLGDDGATVDVDNVVIAVDFVLLKNQKNMF